MRFPRPAQAALAMIAVASVALFAGRPHVFAAQNPPTPPPPGQAGGPPPGGFKMPNPTNLKVLPANFTGEQVMGVMHKWEADLGTGCRTCHTADTKNPGPDGRPRMNFSDDSKEEKQTARKMVQMTQEINASYISKIDSSGAPVTCGTCHRGHLGPEPFVPAPEKDHDHAPAPGAKPAGGR